MGREKGMKKRGREGRCETRKESAGKNSVECVDRRKEMRANIVKLLYSNTLSVSVFFDLRPEASKSASELIGELFA